MKESSLLGALQELLSRHPVFEAMELETSNDVLLPVRLRGTQMEYLVVRDGEDLLFDFNLELDAQRFSETSTIKHAVRNKLPSFYRPDAYRSLMRAVEIDKSVIDVKDLFDSLVAVATDSKMQRLVARSADPPWMSKLRKYNQAAGDWELQKAANELVNAIDSTNVDLVMSYIPDLDHWCDQDPENPLGTQLILLTDLVREQSIEFTQASVHLNRLRKEYVSLSGNWKAEIDEIDHLISMVEEKPN